MERISLQVLENGELQLALEHAQAGRGIATSTRNEFLSELHARPLYRSTAVHIVASDGFAWIGWRIVLNQQQVPFFHHKWLSVARGS